MANLLNNCRNRYLKETIYTYVANILVAINPYKMKPELYNQKMIEKYKGRSLGTLPPHCYAIADKGTCFELIVSVARIFNEHLYKRIAI